MSTTKEINSIVKIKKIKQKLPALGSRSEINHVRSGGENVVQNISDLGNILDVTIETYDDTKDVTIEDINAVQHVIKTGATGKNQVDIRKSVGIGML